MKTPKDDWPEDRIVATVELLRDRVQHVCLIVEGHTDACLYKQLINTKTCKVLPASGKHNAIKAVEKLEARQATGILCIVDSDFWRLDQCNPPSENILLTDGHDAETMILRTRALERLLLEYGSEGKIERFEQGCPRKSVRHVILEGAQKLGYLRWYSIKTGSNLCFQDLKFAAFVHKDTLDVCLNDLVQEVKNRSMRHDIDSKTLIDGATELRSPDHDPYEVCCGHDIVDLLAFALRHAIGSCPPSGIKSDELERSLRLSYEWADFLNTSTYRDIISWSARNSDYKVV